MMRTASRGSLLGSRRRLGRAEVKSETTTVTDHRPVQVTTRKQHLTLLLLLQQLLLLLGLLRLQLA